MSGVKKLYRSRNDKVLCGVCGGVGNYLSIDSTIIRILWVLITVVNPVLGVLLYIISCVLIPEEPYTPQQSTPSQSVPTQQGQQVKVVDSTAIVGLFLTLLGFLIIFKVVDEVISSIAPWYAVRISRGLSITVGLILLVVGLVLIFRSRKE
jgi:phage shock protein C